MPTLTNPPTRLLVTAAFAILVVGSMVVLKGTASPLHLTGLVKGAASAGSRMQKNAATAAQRPAAISPTVVADIQHVIDSGGSIQVAVSVVDLDANTQYNAGETATLFKAASTAKLVTAVAYLHQVEQGNASLADIIGGSTAQELIRQMLEVSDNDAWLALRDALGDNQQSYAGAIGLASFTGGDYNTMTAADEAKLLALLYQGKLLTAEHRDLVYRYMEAADGTDLIKAALPADATVYHKYGLLWGNVHDAAIVSLRGHHFAVVIFTNNPAGSVDDYAGRVALIHDITKTILKNVGV